MGQILIILDHVNKKLMNVFFFNSLSIAAKNPKSMSYPRSYPLSRDSESLRAIVSGVCQVCLEHLQVKSASFYV